MIEMKIYIPKLISFSLQGGSDIICKYIVLLSQHAPSPCSLCCGITSTVTIIRIIDLALHHYTLAHLYFFDRGSALVQINAFDRHVFIP